MASFRCGKRRLAAAAAVAVALVVAASAAARIDRTGTFRVWYVSDGDTIRLTNGQRVRLVQIDSPELGTGECYSRAAARALRRHLPGGAAVTLEADPLLDGIDQHGRLLRYVRRNGVNLNIQMVREGAATVWFYSGDRGRYATQLLAAASAARTAKRGLWGACKTIWNPSAPATSGFFQPRLPAPSTGSSNGCDPSYPDVCIAPPPPDLDCADVPHRNFRVLPPDPHRFDGNRDGRGCER